jgi:hypothetical protein
MTDAAFYSMGTVHCFTCGKAAGMRSWPLTSIHCQGREGCSYTSTSSYVFMAWCLIH